MSLNEQHRSVTVNAAAQQIEIIRPTKFARVQSFPEFIKKFENVTDFSPVIGTRRGRMFRMKTTDARCAATV